MGLSVSGRRVSAKISWLLLWCSASAACSAPGNSNGASGVGGQVAGSAGSDGGSSSSGGAATAGGVGVSGSGGAVAAAGSLSSSGSGGAGGAGGTPTAGAPAGGAGATGGAFAGSGTGGGAGSNSALCQMVKTEYADELDKQLACTPGAGSQCTNKVAAAPGCECRVFIQPADPFAIEHLSNVGNGWFEADCSMASCPAKCSTAAAGTCQADAKSSSGGRCVTP